MFCKSWFEKVILHFTNTDRENYVLHIISPMNGFHRDGANKFRWREVKTNGLQRIQTFGLVWENLHQVSDLFYGTNCSKFLTADISTHKLYTYTMAFSALWTLTLGLNWENVMFVLLQYPYYLLLVQRKVMTGVIGDTDNFSVSENTILKIYSIWTVQIVFLDVQMHLAL